MQAPKNSRLCYPIARYNIALCKYQESKPAETSIRNKYKSQMNMLFCTLIVVIFVNSKRMQAS